MKIVCLDLEGVLVPEIWIAFAEEVGIDGFRLTTRDEPDYDKLMRYRIALLHEHGFKLPDIQKVIAAVDPLEGALDFVRELRERTQLIILSDTFEQFAKPLMKKLEWPTLFCNSLVIGPAGEVVDYTLRQKNGKKKAVEALQSINATVFAAGDSFNDLAMIAQACADSKGGGCLFRAPDAIRQSNASIPAVQTYSELLEYIDRFLV